MPREFQFVDPYTKRLDCEEDFISPPWDDEEEAIYSGFNSCDGPVTSALE